MSAHAFEAERRRFENAPSFFVIGAQKAGTTRLCHLLNGHPEVVIPTKEPFYFHSSEAMRTKRDWYRSIFENAGPGTSFGEGSTYYSMCQTYPGTAERIHDFDPAARIIYMVRHPLRRIESAWFQLLSVREMSGLRSFRSTVMRSDVLIEPTLYWRQLSEYRRYFPDDQIHVATFEEFVVDEMRVANECLAFLGQHEPLRHVDASVAGRNQSEGKLQPRAIVDLVKSVPGYQHLKGLVPERWRIAAGSRLQKEITAVPRWDDDALAYVRARVQDDTNALLEHLGLPDSFWDLSDLVVTRS